MPDEIWKPVSVEDADYAAVVHYQNDTGEEYTHVADLGEVDFGDDDGNPHRLCWSKCSGDWLGSKKDCPLMTEYYASLVEHRRLRKIIPPLDPFNFMLNHESDIDDNNFYVESVDALDGTHWEISVDVSDQILQLLDE